MTTDYDSFPSFPYKARSWSLHLDESEGSVNHRSIRDSSDRHPQLCIGREVFIEARNDAAARRVASILQNAAAILNGSDDRHVFGYDLHLRREPKRNRRHTASLPAGSAPHIISRSNIPFDCLLAVKIARKRQYVYASAKLALSYRLVSIEPIELDLKRGVYLERSQHEDVHVAFAYAIIAAYAAIEEMGLEIRANHRNPSTINGQWNPLVLAELENRLTSSGIDITEDFH